MKSSSLDLANKGTCEIAKVRNFKIGSEMADYHFFLNEISHFAILLITSFFKL